MAACYGDLCYTLSCYGASLSHAGQLEVTQLLAAPADSEVTMGNIQLRRAMWIGLGVFAVLALLSPRLADQDPAIHNLFFRLRGSQAADTRIVIVAVDDQSLAQIGPWPWSPARLADIVQKLDEAGARVIGLDTATLAAQWGGLNSGLNSKAGTDALAEAVRHHKRVVLPSVILPGDVGQEPHPTAQQTSRFSPGEGTVPRPVGLQEGKLHTPPAQLVMAAAGLGAINVTPEADGTLRRMPLVVSDEGQIYPSFAAEVARVFLGISPGTQQMSLFPRSGQLEIGDMTIPVDSAGEIRLNYPRDSAGEIRLNYPRRYPSYKVVPAGQLFGLSPDELTQQVSGKMALVGPTALELAPRWCRDNCSRSRQHRQQPGVSAPALVARLAADGSGLSGYGMGTGRPEGLVVFGNRGSGCCQLLRAGTGAVHPQGVATYDPAPIGHYLSVSYAGSQSGSTQRTGTASGRGGTASPNPQPLPRWAVDQLQSGSRSAARWNPSLDRN